MGAPGNRRTRRSIRGAGDRQRQRGDCAVPGTPGASGSLRLHGSRDRRPNPQGAPRRPDRPLDKSAARRAAAERLCGAFLSRLPGDAAPARSSARMTPPVPANERPRYPVKHTLRRVWSPQLRNRRDVDVYLPASYGRSRRHPVVYMHDGQNLSDPAIAFAGTWQLDSVLRDLAADGLEPIVVGVHNHPDRLAEYSPFPDRKHGGGHADQYLTFLIRTVKPRIDRLFRTRLIPSQTAIVGSSMGGL